MAEKKDFLDSSRLVEHIDIKKYNVVPMVEDMGKMAFQARNLHRAAAILDKMAADSDCTIYLTLAGSLISAGLKQVIVDLMRSKMVDAIVSTGANIVDQDFFEALGFRHYQGTPFVDDSELRELAIDRIYDTYIDEDDLRVCDMTIAEITNSLEPRPYSSREFIREMGRWLEMNDKGQDSIVRTAYELGIPIFVPAFSDCSAGFGLVHHQFNRAGEEMVSIDSAKDFLELTRTKIEGGTSGIFMIGGGVPKNFTQDIVVAGEVLGYDVDMHKYAVQLTVADERDGALSGSTLKEASSWGKVETTYEQMVYGEATVTFPLIAGYAYHKRNWESRKFRRYNDFLDAQVPAPARAEA
ncbi:MAG: 1,9-bis(guanidino)-5-aza-nonane synthase [Chloroflexota bacterium]